VKHVSRADWGAPTALNRGTTVGGVTTDGITIARPVYEAMIAHAYDGAPLEACGLFASPADDPTRITRFVPTDNDAHSAKVYTIPPKAHLKADRDADDDGLIITGVMHSHTHTDPYPSPTDIAQAPDPSWHYIIVSLRDQIPMLRSFHIANGVTNEEPVIID
jgi:[CysO sulfur-carrier protein]-S-L-cysteine hydrolase